LRTDFRGSVKWITRARIPTRVVAGPPATRGERIAENRTCLARACDDFAPSRLGRNRLSLA